MAGGSPPAEQVRAALDWPSADAPPYSPDAPRAAPPHREQISAFAIGPDRATTTTPAKRGVVIDWPSAETAACPRSGRRRAAGRQPIRVAGRDGLGSTDSSRSSLRGSEEERGPDGVCA